MLCFHCFPSAKVFWGTLKSSFYLFLRERESAQSRERERIPRISASTESELYLTNCELMTLVKIKSQWLNRLSHPSAPTHTFRLVFATQKRSG